MKRFFTIITVAALAGFSVKQQFADKNAIAEANQVQGLFVFVDSKPKVLRSAKYDNRQTETADSIRVITATKI